MRYGPNLYPDLVVVSETRTLHSYTHSFTILLWGPINDSQAERPPSSTVTEHAEREGSAARGGYSTGVQVRWVRMSVQRSEGLEVQEEGGSRRDPGPFARVEVYIWGTRP